VVRICPTYPRGHTASPPGHLQHPMSQEKDNQGHHLSHSLFTPLSSRRRGQYSCIKTGTERLKNSLYLKAIRLLNSQLPPGYSTLQLRGCCPIYSTSQMFGHTYSFKVFS
jgi:hypothetical protein